MNVIPRNVTLDDLYIARPVNLADQIPCPLRNIGSQYGLAVFRNPHNVELNIVYRMTRLPVNFPYRKPTKVFA